MHGLLSGLPLCACCLTILGLTERSFFFLSRPLLSSPPPCSYAYILTHPGIPCLFWEHHFDWKLGPKIDELVSAECCSVRTPIDAVLNCALSLDPAPQASAPPQPTRPTSQQVAIRKRAGLRADSPLEILAAEKDLYVARCGGRVTLKLGPRYDMGGLVPKASDGWRMAAKGTDFAVWEKDA